VIVQSSSQQNKSVKGPRIDHAETSFVESCMSNLNIRKNEIQKLPMTNLTNAAVKGASKHKATEQPMKKIQMNSAQRAPTFETL
jgi:predicted ATP-dependent endonuclease of OLD family